MGDGNSTAVWLLLGAAVVLLMLAVANAERGEHCGPDAQPGDCPAPVQEYP